MGSALSSGAELDGIGRADLVSAALWGLTMPEKPRPSLADYFGIVIGPALIMALVGSLVFFLLLILYQGRYETRLHTILFSFVFGVVLIARISMRADLAGRPLLYGGVLGVLVWIGLQQFVDFPADAPLAEVRGLVHLALMGLIWWAAHRLTWDCTHIDEEVEASGKGILESAGLDRSSAQLSEKDEVPAYDDEELRPGILSWWDRYKKYRAERSRRPRDPGVWIVYFSLAALPIFGLGQSLISTEKEGQRRYAFWLMVIYVASGLGLLLTTSFLGLRRYLRQRKLRMPPAMAGTWLASGSVLVLAFLVVCAVLPRPLAEYPILDLGLLPGSKAREASSWGTDQDSPGNGEGRPASEPPGGDKDGSAGSGGEREKGKGGPAQGSQGQGSSGGGQGNGQQGKSQQGGGPSQREQAGQKSESGQGGQQSGSAQRQEGQESSTSQTNPNGQQPEGSARPQGKGPVLSGKPQSGARAGGKAGSGNKPGSSRGKAGPGPTGAIKSLPRLLMPRLHPAIKKALLILAVLVVGFFAVRALLRFLANFSLWAQSLLAALESWWLGLAGLWQRHERAVEDDPALSSHRRRLPFASYGNPFTSGWPHGRTAEELVRYSFEALEAFAEEGGYGRHDDETPLEFTRRLGEQAPGLEAEARRLAGMYSRLAYAHGRLPASSIEALRPFWERLEASVEAPLSA